MSRGVRRDRAERLLVRGFFEEIIKALPTQALADPARVTVHDKFVAAQAAGRVL
jgi:Fe-S cluster assembly scaffold protein SufB